METLRIAGVLLALAGLIFLLGDIDAITFAGAAALRGLPYSVGMLIAGAGLLLTERSPRAKDTVIAGFALVAAGFLYTLVMAMSPRIFTTLGGVSWILATAGATVLAVAAWRWRAGKPAADVFRVGAAMLIVGEAAPVARFLTAMDPLFVLLPLALLVAGLVMLAMAPPGASASS